MAETLVNHEFEIESLNLESIRSRVKEISASLADALSRSLEDSIAPPKRLLDDFSRNLQAVTEDPDVEALGKDDLEAYIEQLKKDLHSAEEENTKVSGEIHSLETIVSADSIQLDADLEALSSLLDVIDSKGLFSTQSIMPTGRPFSGGVLGSQMHASEDYEVLELRQQIEMNKSKLTTLEDLHDDLKRLEAVCSIEDLFCGVKCIQFKDNCIRLSLRTPIPSLDSSSLQKKLDCSLEPSFLDHELLIEVTDTMELKNLEIFPGDLHLGGIINAVKSSRFLPIPMMEDCLGWFIRQIQQHIILCTLRCQLVKDASKSRYSFVYSDPDETITAHLEGSFVALVKISLGWPLSSYPLMLWSLKISDRHSKCIPMSFLCKIQEKANSLDIPTRQDLIQFANSIEQLVKEMQPENSNNTSSLCLHVDDTSMNSSGFHGNSWERPSLPISQ